MACETHQSLEEMPLNRALEHPIAQRGSGFLAPCGDGTQLRMDLPSLRSRFSAATQEAPQTLLDADACALH